MTRITGVCPPELTRSHCERWREALADGRDPAMRDSVKACGPACRDLVSSRLRLAGEEDAK